MLIDLLKLVLINELPITISPTLQSSGTVTTNVIDFIVTNRKDIFKYVTLINTGSDHRVIRAGLNITFRVQRIRMMKHSLALLKQ